MIRGGTFDLTETEEHMTAEELWQAYVTRNPAFREAARWEARGRSVTVQELGGHLILVEA